MGYKLQVGDIIQDSITDSKWEVYETRPTEKVILKSIGGKYADHIHSRPHHRDWDKFLRDYGFTYTLTKSKSSNFNTLYEKLNDNN